MTRSLAGVAKDGSLLPWLDAWLDAWRALGCCRYPVEPLRLLSVGGQNEGGAPELQLALRNDDPPPQVADPDAPHIHADDVAAEEDEEEEAPGAEGGGGWPKLPGFRLQVLSADGVKFEAAELNPLQLHWERQVRVRVWWPSRVLWSLALV